MYTSSASSVTPGGWLVGGLSRVTAAALAVALVGVGLLLGGPPAAAHAELSARSAPRIAGVPLVVGTFNESVGGTAALPDKTSRLALVAGEIRRGNFDVIGVQEINMSRRQAVQRFLAPTYFHSLVGNARDKNPTGQTIFFKPSTVTPGDIQGIIPLPGPGRRVALYQDFTQIGTGFRFLFVSTHLTVGMGRAASDQRTTETVALLNAVASLNAAGLPTVYAGDMNSSRGSTYVYDAPRRVFTSRGIPDTLATAKTVRNANYNSFNKLQKKPATGGFSPDQVYATNGIRVLAWEQMIRVTRAGPRRQVMYRTPFVSDHNPIKVVIALQ